MASTWQKLPNSRQKIILDKAPGLPLQAVSLLVCSRRQAPPDKRSRRVVNLAQHAAGLYDIHRIGWVSWLEQHLQWNGTCRLSCRLSDTARGPARPAGHSMLHCAPYTTRYRGGWSPCHALDLLIVLEDDDCHAMTVIDIHDY
jgi:hypothetical protein